MSENEKGAAPTDPAFQESFGLLALRTALAAFVIAPAIATIAIMPALLAVFMAFEGIAAGTGSFIAEFPETLADIAGQVFVLTLVPATVTVSLVLGLRRFVGPLHPLVAFVIGVAVAFIPYALTLDIGEASTVASPAVPAVVLVLALRRRLGLTGLFRRRAFDRR